MGVSMFVAPYDLFDAINPGDWQAATPNIRFYRPDQRLRVVVTPELCSGRVFLDDRLLTRVQLARGPSGGLIPACGPTEKIVDPFAYAIAVLFDDACMLDRDLEEAGLSLPDRW